ncbi:SDR family NAD(P)-dependent oxidoreductase [Embleya hyalina]|uniref:Short-chain dehydrogenase n=1 Tax=Embleya hyalina TaxID=516124 RepID=A0A401YKU1_9ACTN|nr:SDR family oxidoreductase [Embleya hyalina]GCD95210.1 short-chain dehydrogenase [Embleya hyalina]
MTEHVALVTGAAAGLGRGIALALAAAGSTVVVTARRLAAGAEVADEIAARGGTAWATTCDVTSAESVRAAIEATAARFGRLDAVVHNATSRRSGEPVDLEHADPALWREHADVSLTGSFTVARAAYPLLRATEGALLLLTSPAGMRGSANLSFYAGVKGAQRGFVKALAREWGPTGVRVNGLAPLAVTPALAGAFEADPTMEGRIADKVPMRRVGDPETDIGAPAVFLCGPASRYVTGQTLIVNGGRDTFL